MRGIAAAMVCLLGGCSEKALLIDVVTDGHTKGVELLLVQKPCTDCTGGIGLPGATAKTPGTVLYTDNDLRLYEPVETGANLVRFKIEPGNDDHLLRILAVGFDQQDQPASLIEIPGELQVSEHLGERWEATLAPHPIGGPNAPQSGAMPGQDSVYMWRPPDAADQHASCMKVKHASDSSVEFIVPPVDADCDNITDNECDRTWYQHAIAPDPTKFCLDNNGRNDACRIGNPATCVDGLGKGGCATGSICVPDNACSLCTQLDGGCLDNLNNSGSLNVPRLECSVPLNAAGGVPPFMPCTTGEVTVDGTAFPGCSNPTFAPIGMLTYPVQTVTMFPFAVGTTGTATIHVTPPTATCKFNIGITAAVPDLTTTATRPAAFLLTGEQGDTMAIPLIVAFHGVGNCTGNMTTCAFAPAMTQHVWSCAE